MASIEEIIQLKEVAEEYCKCIGYSIVEKTIVYNGSVLSLKSEDVNKITHSIEVLFTDRNYVLVSDKCNCYFSIKNNRFEEDGKNIFNK